MRNKKLIVLFSVLCALTLLVILSSVVFSIQKVDAHCENMADEGTLTVREAVLNNHGLKKNASIFMVKKDEVKTRVESAVPFVEVVSIEKIFPNRICINYIELAEVFACTDGENTLILSASGKILRVTDSANIPPMLIKLTLASPPVSGQPGAFVTDKNDSSLVKLISSLKLFDEMLGTDLAIKTWFSAIDLSDGNNPVLSTRTGVAIKILDASRHLDEKLQIALATYLKLSDQNKQTGTIKAYWDNAVSKATAAYSET